HAPRVILVHVPLPREGAMRADFALASLSLLFLTGAVVPPKPPSLEGSYRLASRDLPGGSRQVPPAIGGLITYTKGYRNFNIYWKDASGKLFSVSSVATYDLTPKEYREKSIFFLVNDEIGGKGVSYDLSGENGASPVTITGMRVEMQLPLHGDPHIAHDSVERLQGGAVAVVAVRGDALPIGAVAEQTELLGEVLAAGALPDLRENPLVHLCPSPDLGHRPPEVVTPALLPLPDLRAGVPLSIHFVFEDPGNVVQA